MINAVLAVGLVVCGLLLVWISQQVRLNFGDAPKTAIILAPLIVYLLISGKITEFEGLGWKAKFREAVAETVTAPARASDLLISNPAANKPDFFKEAFWLSCRPYYVLTNRTVQSPNGKISEKAVVDIAIAIRSSIVCGRFIALVVVDDTEKPVGYFLPTFFLEIMRMRLVTYNTTPPSQDSVFKDIMTTELGVVLGAPVVRAKSDDAEHLSVRSDTSLEKAYKAMLDKNVGIAMITDRFGRFDGLITRSAIEGHVITKLLATSKK